MTGARPVGPVAAVRIFVSDLAAARRFYAGALGLPEIWSDGESAAAYAPGGGAATSACQVVVESADPDDGEEAALIGRFAGVSFRVDDIEAAVQALEAQGVVFDGPPSTEAWGGRLAHFSDPSGNVLTLVEYPD